MPEIEWEAVFHLSLGRELVKMLAPIRFAKPRRIFCWVLLLSNKKVVHFSFGVARAALSASAKTYFHPLQRQTFAAYLSGAPINSTEPPPRADLRRIVLCIYGKHYFCCKLGSCKFAKRATLVMLVAQRVSKYITSH